MIETKSWYEKLSGAIPDEILLLKDERDQYYLDRANEKRHINYIGRNLLTVPWRNQVVFGVIVALLRQLDFRTIEIYTQQLNSLFKHIFAHFNLTEWEEFNPNEHLYKFAIGEISNPTVRTRSEYLKTYFITLDYQKAYIHYNFDESTRETYKKYLLPDPSFRFRDLRISKKGREESERTRKAETDAVVNMFSEIRAEAHIRFNQVIRLKKAFDDVVLKVQNEGVSLPLEFNYKESDVVGERWYFKLWDKKSFNLAHHEAITPKRGKNIKPPPFFLEFLKAEKIDRTDPTEPEGLWFLELAKLGILKGIANNTSLEQLERVTSFFQEWGYMDENSKTLAHPFNTQHIGILTQSAYISSNQGAVQGILLDVEPLFAAAHFGILALEMCTTSGVRINELLQINYTSDCMIKIKNEGPPPTIRYALRMVPKGRDKLENFYVTEDVMKIISLIIKMLKQHYHGNIPKLEYGASKRQHLFAKKPYIFQYNNRSLGDIALNATLKFLCHGIAFETQEGKKVHLKTHLLRHAFATHAVQGEGLPVDIVAILLHQKDFSVTKYYSRPTATQVSESIEELHTAFAGDIDIAEIVLRTPIELEDQLREYKENVGTVNKTLGGLCTLDKICPKKMACLGCAAKVPQPENKEELEQEWKFYDQREKYYRKKGINFEANKCKVAKRNIKKELKEIELIEKYRKDENFAPTLHFR
ncbi:site-specific integrase [Lysinibacillus fusiformis]|uniref:site-specific integrase n=1 Tax=Lysinibacillus fusiformis TaxID=28031 RepID=UPI002E1CAB58|nr:site-specific integrase [Lysinibacillus fusiformis]